MVTPCFLVLCDKLGDFELFLLSLDEVVAIRDLSIETTEGFLDLALLITSMLELAFPSCCIFAELLYL